MQPGQISISQIAGIVGCTYDTARRLLKRLAIEPVGLYGKTALYSVDVCEELLHKLRTNSITKRSDIEQFYILKQRVDVLEKQINVMVKENSEIKRVLKHLIQKN